MVLINTGKLQLKSTTKLKKEKLMLSMHSKLETHSTTVTFSYWKIPENNYWKLDTRTQFSYYTHLEDGLRMMMPHLMLEWNNIKLYWMMEP